MTHLNMSQAMYDALQKELTIAWNTARQWELLATVDDLTGLHNRRMFRELEQRMAEQRDPMLHNKITMLFIDLDDFGQLNKKYGDDVGDDALRLLGKKIRENIRSTDIAIRKGGDEFVILLMGSTPELANESVTKRLEKMLDGGLTLSHNNTQLPIRGSIGTFPYDESLSPLENVKHADELMRTQKQARKKNKV